MKKLRREKPDAKTLRPLNPEELRLPTAGAEESAGGGLLAFPFIQQAM